MSAAIYSILDDLRHLPSSDVVNVARYIHELREARHVRRKESLAASSGSLSGPDGDAFEAAIMECEQKDDDHGSW
jgi:hypothetical protein